MFSVIFEVLPNKANWNDYLDNAKMLRPELEKVDGFVDNVRYKSLTRDGWILSLSNWRDEKSLVRWRTHMRHHEVQQKGRDEILADYHLRVGQITADDHLPAGYALTEQRLDKTEVGRGPRLRSSTLHAHPGCLRRTILTTWPSSLTWSVGRPRAAPGIYLTRC
ncbi:MAG TPA: antibiotic biosynthesis monooxygenase [Roseiarcus sp.]